VSDKSVIEWTDASWNPVTGCAEVSPGCDHCYAKRFAERFRGVPGHPYEQGFDLTLRPERLDQPLRWRRPRRIFVNSMSDLFHADVPQAFIAQVWDVMVWADWHTFQVLTKRAERMERLISRAWGDELLRRKIYRNVLESLEPPANIWLGVSVESTAYYSRIRHLQRTPAAVRFLSLEPLLGPLPHLPLEGIGWVIVGGESGPGARPMHPHWVRDIRDQCQRAGVPFFFKQWGEWRAMERWGEGDQTGHLGPPTVTLLDGCLLRRVGKHAAGRELDGRTWDEYPVRAA
jgi:protein gp37